VAGGEVLVGGQAVRGDIGRFMRRHIGMLPTNRKENSVIPDFSVLDNVVLAEHSISGRRQIVRRAEELARYDKQQRALSIRAESPDDSINSLSGGNQQKVFLARWLNTDAEILLFDNPTQGVDVGAKAEIYRLINEFAEEGKTVIINTLEIPEIRKVSDRCVVFYSGRVVKIFEHADINERDVMLYSTNAVQEAEVHVS
ncbi:MAG: ATP-binding cassette domain-containing protein, partial [Clostridiales Family XIII bacterium]|jgi:ribose transport system ATP-binding protein|nr:ATP-binding cassette domain-containing protein [Clostridiales Family XIII bacterium]